MDCWQCRHTAVGVFRFCGRGVRENHATTRPFILDLIANRTPTRALVVEDAPHCGTCTPRPDPLDRPELDG